jgi:hypothetical protein
VYIMSTTDTLCDAPRPLYLLEHDVDTHVPFDMNLRDWQQITYGELYSGMRLIFFQYAKWYAQILFVGRYSLARDDETRDFVFVFVERSTSKLYMRITSKSKVDDEPHIHGVYQHNVFPLLTAELEDDVAAAQKAASRLCMQTSSGAMGFLSPFSLPLRGSCVTLPRVMIARMLMVDNDTRTFYIPTSDTRGLIAFKPRIITRARNLGKDGVFALFAPVDSRPTTQLHITPNQLDLHLLTRSVFVYTSSFDIDTPRAKKAMHAVGPRIDCTRLHKYYTVIGSSLVLQLRKKDNFMYNCRFVGLGHRTDGKLMVVVHVKGTHPDFLHSVPCDAIYKMWEQSSVADAVFTKFAAFEEHDFVVPPSFPTTYAPKKPDVLATKFFAVATTRDCTKDAWMQREGTCWATSILNVITLTPTLRREFENAVITPQPLNPAWRAAKAIQDAIKCKSSADAPFCAFTGPEMVCTLLRNPLTAGGDPFNHMLRICEAANISFTVASTVHDYIDSGNRFNLILTNTIENNKNTGRDLWWDIESHAAAAIMMFEDDVGGSHAIAGIRCPTGDPVMPAKYLLVDQSNILSSPDWLQVALGRQFRMNQLATWLAYPGLRRLWLYVLFDLGSVFPISSLAAIDTQ